MKSAVLVIDLQHEFIGQEAIFPVPGGEQIGAQIENFLTAARAADNFIIFTAFAIPDSQPVGRSTQRWNSDRAHRYPDARILESLEILDSDIVLEKPRQSAFVGTSLDLILKRLGVEHIIITGVTTHSCCLATAIDAAALDYEVTVLADLTASVAVAPKDGLAGLSDLESHEAALNLMAYSCGRVTTSDQMIKEWANQE